MYSEELVGRFWGRVDKQGDDECWKWTGSIKPNGYGVFMYRGGNWNAHRLAFELSNGTIQDGMVVMHSCDNRSCVNPNHLKLGTQKDNIQDMIRKGRGNPACGIRSRGARLNWRKACEIRLASASGVSAIELADLYGVDSSTISSVVKHISWADRKKSTLPKREKPDKAIRKTPFQRIFDLVTVTDDDHWIWNGYVTKFPVFKFDGMNIAVHKFLYENWIERIESGKQMCRICDIKNCVNPAHYTVMDERELHKMRSVDYANRQRQWYLSHPEEVDGYNQENFWENVKKTDSCWIWTGKNYGSAYGVARQKKPDGTAYATFAHRVSYILNKGEIGDGLVVCHACDNPRCVNPDHLWLGTKSDNSFDMIEKGRAHGNAVNLASRDKIVLYDDNRIVL